MKSGAQLSVEGAATALWATTISFAACFAVWTIFSIIGIGIKDELGLSSSAFGLLLGAPILSGSLARFVAGIWADQIGGRRVMAVIMLVAAASTLLLSYAGSYAEILLAALAVGVAGGLFSAGATYVLKFYPGESASRALGILGAGNAGAAVTHLIAPLVMIAMGWQAVAQIWATVLAAIAVLSLILTREDDDKPMRHARGRASRMMHEQLAVLKNLQIWRFSFYYFFLFGGFVALALWLPHYLMGVYGLDIRIAGLLSAAYVISTSMFWFYGGQLADRYGARIVLYLTFAISLLCTFMLSYPPTTYTVEGVRELIIFHTSMGLVPFFVIIVSLGFVMGLGRAAVFKQIPVYYPNHVGVAGGLVGMIGGLGGFVLPLAFGVLNDLTGVWTSAFALMFLLVAVSLIWMYGAIRHMEREAVPSEARDLPELPEMQGLGEPGVAVPPRIAGPIADWRPEDPEFWKRTGRPIAQRNLWISTYCLLLSFAVWMVWSVIVAQLPSIGFKFTTDQLFWLAAVPGLSGATLRIFYAFLVPIFGGRLWTTLSTASLLIPAFGIGYAVQDPETPYLIFLALALLSGFGGGNFSSSVANISFFYPKSEKGYALAVNSGLGNLGVSLMQLIVPIAVTMSLFGALGGQSQVTADGAHVWMQNAGFVWVPLILIGTVAAWFGMNDILSAKSSFADQAKIFRRTDTWTMSWLYTGTFGTFIGMSAGFPLLAGLVFPDVNVLTYAFIGPLVGALARAGSGRLADQLGGAGVTFWVFWVMIAATLGMIWFLDVRSFWGFFGMVLLLFLASGVGNASTFQMVPGIMRREMDRTLPQLPESERRLEADRQSAAIVGFISAIAAYGAFYIPKVYGYSIAATGNAKAALWSFLIFYLSCAILTWYRYSGPRGTFQSIARSSENERLEPASAHRGETR